MGFKGLDMIDRVPDELQSFLTLYRRLTQTFLGVPRGLWGAWVGGGPLQGWGR